MNEKLTDAFDRAVPEQPPTSGWGRKVRGRVARRRAVTGAALGVGAVALAVPLALNLGGSDVVLASPEPVPPTQSSEVGEGPDYPVESHERPECREADGTRVRVTELPGGKLPEGAERIWLCGGGHEGAVVNDTELVGARDALTVGVDRAVEAFNALNYVEGAAVDCVSDDSTYHVVVEYPGGQTEVVQGFNTPDGCDHFQLGGGVVDGGAQGYLDLLAELWAEQRAGQPVPEGDVQVCPAATSVWGIDPSSLTRGYACVPAGDEPRMQEELPQELVDRIVEGMSGTERAGTAINPTAPRLILINEHDDPVTLRWQTFGDGKALVWGGGWSVWRTDAALDAGLAEVFGAESGGPVHPEPEASVPPVPTDLTECPSASDAYEDGINVTLGDLIPHGYVCLETNDGVVTRPLDDALAADILADLQRNAEPRLQQPLVQSTERLVLWSRWGDPLSISWMGGGYLATYPGGTWNTWFPPVELSSRIYGAITGGAGSCVAPEPVDPASVTVDVYTTTGDAEVAERVAEGLREAGFTVREVGLTTDSELGGGFYVRHSPDNGYAAGWVGGVLGQSGSGAVSRTDDVVDVVLNADYDVNAGFVPVDDARPRQELVCS